MRRWWLPVLLVLLGAVGVSGTLLLRPKPRFFAECQFYDLDQAHFLGRVDDLKLQIGRRLQELPQQSLPDRTEILLRKNFLESKMKNLDDLVAVVTAELGRGIRYDCMNVGPLQSALDYPGFSDLEKPGPETQYSARDLKKMLERAENPPLTPAEWLSVGIGVGTLLLAAWAAWRAYRSERRTETKAEARIIQPGS